MKSIADFENEMKMVNRSVVESVKKLDQNLKSKGIEFASKPLTVEEVYGQGALILGKPAITSNTSSTMYFCL